MSREYKEKENMGHSEKTENETNRLENCGCGCGSGDTESCGCGCGCEGAEGQSEDNMGHFQGFVLLNTVATDIDGILHTLKEEWGIVPDEEEGSQEHCHTESGDAGACSCSCEDDNSCDCEDDGCDCGCEETQEDNTRVFSIQNSLVAISLMPAPIPEGEAEYFAQANYMWPDAVEVTKTHVAHLLVAVMPHGISAVEAGKIYTKVVSCCLKQENAIGVYTSGTVFQPEFYIEVAEMMKDNEEELPILDWIYLGLYRSPSGNNAYTYGMTAFGRTEIEIVGSQKSMEELRDFLYQISCYVIGYDEVLLDGETIGFTEEQRLPITLSPGAAIEGESLKIEF